MFAELGCIELRHGPMRAVVSPGCGGSIVRLCLDTPGGPVDLMRASPPGALVPCDPLALGSFPLVPFSNRIGHGRFSYGGRDVELALNRAPMPHPIHGHGWLVPWRTVSAGNDRAELEFRHEPDDWPWPYTARQVFELSSDALAVTIGIENTGAEPMPAGLGFHPYFPKPPGTRLTTDLSHVWTTDETALPDRRIPVPDEWDFGRGIVMDETVLDNGFTGWSGHARIDWPSAGLAMEIEADQPLRHLVVYAPAGQPWFCVEPVSHMTDALNRRHEADSGLIDVPGGGCVQASVRFRVL